MLKATWKKRIIESCRAAGTYRDYFMPVIDTLADILEKRDNAQTKFEQLGGNTIVLHTNKAGAQNLEQNPALRLVNDLNRDALAYWRDLGLTPAGLKKIDENALKARKKSSLAEALRELGG